MHALKHLFLFVSQIVRRRIQFSAIEINFSLITLLSNFSHQVRSEFQFEGNFESIIKSFHASLCFFEKTQITPSLSTRVCFCGFILYETEIYDYTQQRMWHCLLEIFMQFSSHPPSNVIAWPLNFLRYVSIVRSIFNVKNIF